MSSQSFIVRLQALMFALLLLIGVNGAASAQTTQKPKGQTNTNAQTRPLDFSSIVVMGDSLSQSYNDGVLHVDAQSQNYLSFLSKQIGFDLRQALIAEPGGFGSRFSLKDASRPIKPLTLSSFLNLTLPPEARTAGRIDPNVRVNNYAIGGAKVRDIINARPDPANPNSAIFASLGIPYLSDNGAVPRSQLEFVENTDPKPTLAILFIGGNDALGAASNSRLELLTPASQFLADYEEIVRRTKATGAQMILVTVPDVTSVAAFISTSDLQAFVPIPPDMFGPKTGLKKGDFVTLRAFAALVAITLGQSQGPLPEDQILRKQMAAKISKEIKKYNKGIMKIGKREGFPVVDLNRFLSQAASKDGFVIPGVGPITTKYFGGVASFDGVHITATANAVLANAFLEAINKTAGTNFPMVDVTAVALADSQVPKAAARVEPDVKVTEAELKQAQEQFKALGNAFSNLFNFEKK